MITSYAKSIADVAKQAAKILKRDGKLKRCHKMCGECAFKWDQPHTLQYFLAADTAAGIVMGGGEFHCHTHDYKDEGKLCGGFLMTREAFEGEKFETA